MTQHLPMVTVALIFLCGLGALFFKRNLIKMLMGVTLVESAVNLFLVGVGYRARGIAPIFTGAPEGTMVLPTVQALTLTAIVIGVATTAMMLSFAVIIYRHYGTTNITRVNKLNG